MRVSRLCRCGEIVQGTCERCDSMKAAKADDYRIPFRHLYPTGWDALSLLYRQENPLCENCESKGKSTPAIEVHHKIKVKLRPDLALDRSNLIAVCRACHIELERHS